MYYFSDYYDVSVNKYGVKGKTSLRFGESKGWIKEIDPHAWLQWYFRYWLGRKSEDDEKQLNRGQKIVSRFRGKSVKMIRDADGKFVEYFVSRKTQQVLLHWSYELTEKYFFISSTN